jgi:hypothetical protein
MVASLRNLSARGVRIGVPPTPPTPPLFVADFSAFSNGTLNGQSVAEYDPAYANAAFGTWPAGAPLYSGVPWPEDWFGYTPSQFATPWYIDSGRLYENGTNNYPGVFLPLYIPNSALANTVRFTVRFIAVDPKPANPADRILPFLYLVPTKAGDEIPAQLAINQDDSPNNILYNGNSYFDYDGNPSDFSIPEVWDGLEHTMVWEMNTIGQVALTYDSTPYGQQSVPWYTGYEPTDETYVALSADYLGDADTIGSFGYTYISVEAL